MVDRPILVEGLPGTGKTTIVKWLFDLLQENGKPSILLLEDDERIPSNFNYVAGVPKSVIYDLFPAGFTFPESFCTKTENFVYLKIDKFSKEAEQELKRWDIGDESNPSLSLQEYITCTLEWWRHWSLNCIDQSTMIMDSAFMQNPINEMIFRKATNGEIKLYISAIADLLAHFNPVCIYLRRNNAAESIEFAKIVKGPAWSAGVEGLQQAGYADLFQRRYELEFEMLNNMSHLVCDIHEKDWSSAKEKLKKYFAM